LGTIQLAACNAFILQTSGKEIRRNDTKIASSDYTVHDIDTELHINSASSIRPNCTCSS